MKLLTWLITSIFVLAFTVSCKKDKDPKTLDEKVSYSIGQQIGRSIKIQEITVDYDMLAQSIREAAEGKDSRLSVKDMQEVMMEARKQKMEEREKQAEENIGKGKKYLEENGKKDGVKTTESGLQYQVMTEGEGKMPSADDKVRVHYKGTLIDGKEFDSSYKNGEPAEFPVKGVIKGWTEALQLMKEGAKWKLFIPSDLAYGKMGRPGIPPNAVLVFEVELLKILGDEPEAAKEPMEKPKDKAHKAHK